MEGIVVRMFLSLAGVLGLMAGLFYLAKRFVLPTTGSVRMPVQVEVLGRRALQPKKSIVVVRVAGKVLVLGLSEQGMQTLTSLTEEDLHAAEATSLQPIRGISFATHLQETLRGLRRRAKAEVLS